MITSQTGNDAEDVMTRVVLPQIIDVSSTEGVKSLNPPYGLGSSGAARESVSRAIGRREAVQNMCRSYAGRCLMLVGDFQDANCASICCSSILGNCEHPRQVGVGVSCTAFLDSYSGTDTKIVSSTGTSGWKPDAP